MTVMMFMPRSAMLQGTAATCSSQAAVRVCAHISLSWMIDCRIAVPCCESQGRAGDEVQHKKCSVFYFVVGLHSCRFLVSRADWTPQD